MKKTVKRILSLLLVGLMLVSIAACNSGTKDGGSSSGSSGNGNDGGSSGSGNSSGGNNSGSSSSPDSSSGSGSGNTSGGNNSGTAATSGRDTLNIAVTSDSGTLNPINASGDFGAICRCINENLWDVDEYKEKTWVLATGVEEVADDHWIVHIREGVTFSNGNPLTAQDVLFSIILTSEGGFSSSPRVQNVDVPATSVIDDYTLDLRLLFFHISAWTILSDLLIFDEESYDAADFAINPIGTGPYVLKEYVVNSYTTLTMRDDYWGEKPSIPNLTFRVLAEPSQIVNALETGAIDIGPIAADDFDYVSALPGFSVESRPGTWTAIYFNLVVGNTFNSLDARNAVSHAINRDVITDIVYIGHATVMNSIVSTGAWDYEPRYENVSDTYSIGYDLALAKELADRSGLTGQTIRVITNGTAPHVTIAEIMQSQLQEIGVTVVINNYDVASFMSVVQDPSRTMYEIWIGSVAQVNRMVADPMVNGVRYSEVYREPGVWDDIWTFLEVGPECFYNPDPQAHSDNTYQTLKLYQDGNLSYALCDYLSFTAFSKELKGPFVWRCTGRMLYKNFSFI